MPKLKKRSVQHKSAASGERMKRNRISENGGGDHILENSGKPIVEGLKSPTDSQGYASSDNRLLYSDVGMIRPIVTSEASMKTSCDVNAAEIATNCTSHMMNGTESALKCSTNVVEATTSKSQAARSITKCMRKQAHAMKPKQTIKDAVKEARVTTEFQ
ncbi:hypothetical protein DPMN_140828 [Dreissena polymorpha]|uniref:Uncharacterized protein n=1 Tax=Dreissena polymorpha TaxID=45954 RepID=A0A9D4G8U4_DREPO|nr:hypothetical protein DPMN_140828 [Dreissena polymorpha]